MGGYSSTIFREFNNIPTTGTGVAYTANDQVGDLQTLSSFFQSTTNVWRFAGGSVSDADNTGAFMYALLFFSRSVTLAADNAAYSVSDADSKFFAAITGQPASAGNTVSAGGLNRLYTMPYYQMVSQNPTGEFLISYDGSFDLYFAMVTVGGTPMPARTSTTGLRIKTLWELVAS